MAHVNEFDTRSKDQTRGIQTDTRKLKFNNIQSCIAVVLCIYDKSGHGAPTVNRLVGVHINTINLNNSELELNVAISRLKQGDNTLLDIYLVGPYDQYYVSSKLATKLKYLQPRYTRLFNLTPAMVGDGANNDVKVEVQGNQPLVYYRDCVKMEYGHIKDKYNPAAGGTAFTTADFKAGKHQFVNDRDQKPWTRVTAFRDL